MLSAISVITMLEDEIALIKEQMAEEYSLGKRVSESRQRYVMGLEDEVIAIRKKLKNNLYKGELENE